MRIVAQVQNSLGKNEVTLRTNDNVHSVAIPSKPTGFGSRANGGELLFLALATCYCNDIYREAAHRGINVVNVEVTVEGDSGRAGKPARNATGGRHGQKRAALHSRHQRIYPVCQ
jgi:uncharacterized OsmC-like protein